MSTTKAITTTVPYGLKTLGSLMAPDGTYGVAVSQVAELFQIPINHASRDLKAILGKGKDFQFLKWKTDLNSKAVNVLTLEEFSRVLINSVSQGNIQAINFWNEAYPNKAVKVPKQKKVVAPKGFIYVLEANNTIKVGFSINVKRRIKALQRWPGEIELVMQIKGDIEKEQKIHRHLHETGESLGREWYPLDRKQEIISFVSNYIRLNQ